MEAERAYGARTALAPQAAFRRISLHPETAVLQARSIQLHHAASSPKGLEVPSSISAPCTQLLVVWLRRQLEVDFRFDPVGETTLPLAGKSRESRLPRGADYSGGERTTVVVHATPRQGLESAWMLRNPLTERRRSRTDRAWGYHTAQVLKTRWGRRKPGSRPDLETTSWCVPTIDLDPADLLGRYQGSRCANTRERTPNLEFQRAARVPVGARAARRQRVSLVLQRKDGHPRRLRVCELKKSWALGCVPNPTPRSFAQVALF